MTLALTLKFKTRSRLLYAVTRLSSVMFLSPAQPVEIFSNVSTSFNTLTVRRHPRKILQRSSQGILRWGGGLNARG